MEHECLHEPDFAVMQKDLSSINKCQLKILKILEGDNGTGIKTRVALNKASIQRVWYWVGGISLLIPIAVAFGYFVK